MFFDRLLVGGLRFVLETVASAADAERDDAEALRERLLAAQLERELGAIDEAELVRVETEVLARLRELEEERRAAAGEPKPGGRVTGVEVELRSGHEDDPPR